MTRAMLDHDDREEPMPTTRDAVVARRQRDTAYRPGDLRQPRVPAVVPAPELHLWEHARAVRVPASVALNGAEVVRRPNGEYEARCECGADGCNGEWWYLPADPQAWRAFAMVERSRALVAQVGRALVDAEASTSRTRRAFAALHAQDRTR
jgi:hypothetical protein